jgi:hypothetical protein
MKSLLISVALLVVSANASASEFLPNIPEIQSIEQSRNMMPTFFPDRNGNDRLPANPVQTYITVNYASCAQFGENNFQVSKVKTAEGYVVSVRIAPQTIDCMAIGRLRTIVLNKTNLPVLGKAIVRQDGRITEIQVPYIELQ